MSIKEVIQIILKNKKSILTVTALSMLFLFLILLFVYPVTYSAEIKILPPAQEKIGGLSSLLGSDASGLMGLSSKGETSPQLYEEILKSRSAAEFVVKKCRLAGYFDTQNKYVAAEKLKKILNTEVTKEGLIILSADVSSKLFGRFSSSNDSTRNLSARISNAYADALDLINREKLNTKARRTREYIEKQINCTKRTMDSSETALRTFQQNNKAISLPEQLKASIENAAKIKSEIMLTEIQIGTLGANVRAGNTDLQGLEKKLEQLKLQYSAIEAGDKLNNDYLPSFGNIPKISLELARLTRAVAIQNEVYLMLQKQYYSEKIEETRDIPTVEVLDCAIPPLKEKSPRPLFYTFSGGVFVFLLLSLFSVYTEKRK